MSKGAKNLFVISVVSYITIGQKSITMWPVIVGVTGIIYDIAPRWHLGLVGVGLVGLPAGVYIEKNKRDTKTTSMDIVVCTASIAAIFGGFASLIYSSKLITE